MSAVPYIRESVLACGDGLSNSSFCTQLPSLHAWASAALTAAPAGDSAALPKVNARQ